MNSAVPFWFASAAGGDGPVPPIPTPDIGRSVRIRPGSVMTRASDQNTGSTAGTFSLWYKAGYNFLSTALRTIWEGANNGSQQLNSYSQNQNFRVPSDATATIAGPLNSNNNVLRDPSAWYHVVTSWDATTTNLWINGVLFGTIATGNSACLRQGTHIIGAADTGGTVQPFDGYLAEFFILENRTLGPEVFGRFNNQGVWVPRATPIGLGFDAAANPQFSNFLFTSTDTSPDFNSTATNFEAGTPATNAFDGITTTTAQVRGPDTSIIYRPDEAIENVTRIRVNYGGANGGTIGGFNGGNEVLAAAAGWNVIFNGVPGPVDVENIYIRNGGTTFISAIEIQQTVDGATVTTVLTDPFQWSADLTSATGFQATLPPQNAFNGQTGGNGAGTNGTGASLVFAPSETLTITELAIFTEMQAGGTLAWNGNTVDTVRGDWTVITDTGELSATNTMVLTSTAASTCTLRAVRINGNQILINSVNPAYGQNGVRLQFADPNDLGRDTSGNGNDYTPNANFDTDRVGIFSNFVFSSANPLNVNSTDTNVATPEDGFNNNLTNATNTTNTNDWLIFRPTQALTDITSVDFQALGISEAAVNGTVTTFAETTSTNPTNIYTGAAITVTSIAVRSTGGTNSNWNALRVNGQVLVDNTGADYDSMQDSPTQNYSTYQPLGFNNGALAPTFVLNDGNLGYTISSNPDVGFTFFTVPRTGRYYFETRPEGGEFVFRIYAPKEDNASANNVNVLANIFNQNLGGTNRWTVSNNGALAPNGSVNKTGPADTQVVIDATNGRIYLGDGTANNWLRNDGGGTYTIGAFDATRPSVNYSTLPAHARNNLQIAVCGTTGGSINFGQQPFFMDIPNGWDTDTVFQTQNLPAAPVTDGREHCRVLQAAGAAIFDCSQGELNDQHGSTGFASGLYWVKDRANASTQWQLFSSASASGNTYNVVANNTADVTFDPYVAPAGNSVAYCWNTTTSGDFTAGTINSTCFTDQAGGFSVVRYTGDGNNNATVAHNLPGEVDFMIVAKFDGTGANHLTYWRQEGNESVPFNTNGGFATNATLNAWGTNTSAGTAPSGGQPTATNDTTFQLGNITQVNNNGEEYQAWCWTTISGYSAFGTYEGNGNGTGPNGDGPYIFTNFTPRVVLIKEDNTGNDWVIFDSTQNETNPCRTLLEPNTTDAQSTADNNAIDFLSNGFKIRTPRNAINRNGGSFYYAAWGASPFGGSNILPRPAALRSPQPTPADGNVGVVSNSLRFRGGQRLFNNNFPGNYNADNNVTLSMWIKRGNVSTLQTLGCLDNGGNQVFGRFQADGRFDTVGLNVGFNSAGRYRDPTAWYHLVVNNEGVWINGEGVFQGACMNGVSGQSRANFGCYGANVIQFVDGLMADIYLVDGANMAPTDFAEYDANGVWAPRLEDDITTSITNAGGYGPNGFRLIMNQAFITFGDTPVLQDQSGNNNDFEMVDFELVDETSLNFDLFVDGPATNFATANPLMPGFNGSTRQQNFTFANLGFAGGGGAGSLPFGYSTIPSISGTNFYVETQLSTAATTSAIGATYSGALNDGAWGSDGSAAWFSDQTRTWLTISGVSQAAASPGNRNTVGAIGSIQYNCSGIPEVTFALNGANPQSVTMGDFNPSGLWIGANASQTTPASLYFNFGQQPYQFRPGGVDSAQARNLPAATITDPRDQCRAIVSNGPGAPPAGAANQLNGNWSQFLFSSDGDAAAPDDPNSTMVNAVNDTTLRPGNAFNNDNTTGAAMSPLTGVSPTSAFAWLIFRPETPIPIAQADRGNLVIRCGRTSELYVNGVDTGLNNNTVNFADLTVTDGTIDEIRSIWLFGSATVGSQAQLSRITINGTPLVDFSILAQAQNTFTNGLWLIKSLTAQNQWQFVDSVRGGDLAIQSPGPAAGSQQEVAYAASNSNCAAYCWNLNTANPETNGFNILTWTGTGGTTDRLIPHGLGRRPGLFLAANRDNNASTNSIGCAIENIPDGQMFQWNNNAAPVILNGGFGSGIIALGDATNVIIRAGNVANIEQDNYNRLNLDYVGYVWAPVEGYSSFGTFGGSATAAALPFVYTGFRPAMLWIKSTGATNWFVVDATTNPLNPTTTALAPNIQNAASTGTANNVDLLSNGFKIRVSNGTISSTVNNPFYYCAWASNPFGGANVQPGVAR